MKKEKIYCGLLLLIIIGIFEFGIHKICGFTLIPDEFGYWASAAKNVGYDWTEVASLGSYYSFGYSLILTPILKIFYNGVNAYRAAVAVNMLLMCGGLYLLIEIIRRLFPETDEIKRVMISGIAVFYPPWIFYMQMTMAEALLYFLFIWIVCIFICFIQKPKVSTAILLALSLIYMYCVHMRTVGILIACVFTVTFWIRSERNKKEVLFIFWSILLALIVLAFFLKQNTISGVFANTESQKLAGNDYGGQWEKFKQILTIHGIWQFIREILAKIYYLGAASFGIFYWGFAWAWKESLLLLKKLIKKEKGVIREWAALLLFLSATGEILISSIYMYQGGLIDTLIYGRYDEFLMPVFLAVGIVAMSRSKHLFINTVLPVAGTAFLTETILKMIKVGNLEGLRGYMVAGISYLLREDKTDVSGFFRNTWVLICSMMLLVVCCVWLSEKNRKATWFLAGILAIEITAGLHISQHYTYRVNSSNFMDLSITDKIKEQMDNADRVLYLDEGMPEYIDFLQMQLGAKSIEVITEEQLRQLKQETQSAFLITHVDTQYQEELEDMFQKCLKANTFSLFYNQKEGA